jgi:hypothetical protein
MKKTILLLLLVSFSLSTFTGCDKIRKRFGSTDLFDINANNVSASQYFPQILERAKEWQSDAQLYGIPETKVNLNGEAPNWTFLFSSNNTSRQASILINSSFITFKETRQNTLKPISRWTIDSITAAVAGKRFGGEKFTKENSGAYLMMSLFGVIPGTRKDQPLWILKYYGKSQALVIGVDANTGEEIKLPNANY